MHKYHIGDVICNGVLHFLIETVEIKDRTVSEGGVIIKRTPTLTYGLRCLEEGWTGHDNVNFIDSEDYIYKVA
jgi:hypothetical protein